MSFDSDSDHGQLVNKDKEKIIISPNFRCYLYRCNKIDETYDEILRNTTDKQSKISLQTIEYMTKLFTNFAKYG